MSERIIIHEAGAAAPELTGPARDIYDDFLRRFGPDYFPDPVGVRMLEPDGTLNGTVGLITHAGKWLACKRLKLPCKIEVYDGQQSPAQLAAASAMLGTQLTDGQRLAVAVDFADVIAEEAKKRQKAGGGTKKTPPVNVHASSGGSEEKTALAGSKSAFAKFGESAPDDQDSGDSEAVHTRVILSSLSGFSTGKIGDGIRLKREAPELFGQLRAAKLTFAQANSEVRRRIKSKQIKDAYRALPELARKQIEAKVVTGDALKILPALKRNAFRLILLDPPYNIGVDYGGGVKADLLPDAHYLGWCDRWMKMLPDLLTPDGSVWIVIDQKYVGEYLVQMKRTGLKLRSIITWYETFGANCVDKFNRTSRYLLYFVRNEKRLVFHADKFKRPSDRLSKYNDPRANPNGKLWDDVWIGIPRLVSGEQRIPGFPTQLPLGLVLPIIDGCSDDDDNILDFFGGSGTTAAACATLGSGRRCLTIEQNPKFAEMARARIAGVVGGQR